MIALLLVLVFTVACARMARLIVDSIESANTDWNASNGKFTKKVEPIQPINKIWEI